MQTAERQQFNREADFQDLASWRLCDPDELKAWGEQCQSFLYDGTLYLDPDKTGRSHASFFNKGKSKTAERLRAALLPKLGLRSLGWGKDKLGGDAVVFQDAQGTKHAGGQLPGWFELYNDAVLAGRVGNFQGHRVVSFWGSGADGKGGPVHLIPACVQELYLKDAVDDGTVVVYGDGRVCRVADLLPGSETGAPGDDQIDPEITKRTELARRMHLATGAEKHEIMKQLGVGGGGSEKENHWNRALRANGLQAPGGSYWKMSSESKQRRLEDTLDGLA